EKAVPLRLFVRLMHGRIGIVVTGPDAAAITELDHLGQPGIVVDAHRETRGAHRRDRATLLTDAHGGGVRPALGDLQRDTAVAADAELAAIAAVTRQQPRQPRVIHFAFGHVAGQVNLITLLH